MSDYSTDDWYFKSVPTPILDVCILTALVGVTIGVIAFMVFTLATR